MSPEQLELHFEPHQEKAPDYEQLRSLYKERFHTDPKFRCLGEAAMQYDLAHPEETEERLRAEDKKDDRIGEYR